MRKVKLTRARQECFLEALADTGSVTTAVAIAGTSRTRVYELRKADPVFAAAWEEAEDIAADRLEEEARRRAVEGVAEPLVSAGKLVRGDDGKPITVQRYSDNLLLALLKTRRLPRRERSVRFVLPALHSAADAPNALAAIAAAVGTGEITPAEAGELSRVVETYVKALQAQNKLPVLFYMILIWSITGLVTSSYSSRSREGIERRTSAFGAPTRVKKPTNGSGLTFACV